MPKVKFSDLDLIGKHVVFWLADQADALTPNITAAAAHVGEIWEVAAFMKAFPKGGLRSTPPWPTGCGSATRAPRASSTVSSAQRLPTGRWPSMPPMPNLTRCWPNSGPTLALRPADATLRTDNGSAAAR